MNKLSILLTIAFSILTLGGRAQDSDLKTDTLQATVSAQKAVELLVAQKVARLNDSIQIASIELGIENSKTVAEKRKLEAQLRYLEAKDSIKMAALRTRIDSARNGAIGYAVCLGYDTICLIYTSNGSFTAEERATTNSNKLETAASVYLPTDSLVIRSDESLTQILFGDNVLITITAVDALWAQKSASELSQLYRERMLAAIAKYQHERSLSTILTQIGLSLLVIFGCMVLVWTIGWIFRKKLNPYLTSKKDIWFKGWKFRSYEIMDSQRQLNMILFMAKIFRWFTTIIIIYIALPLLFSIFPFTQRLANTLLDWVWNPVRSILLGIWHYIPNLLTILVILLIVHYILRWFKILAREIQKGNIDIPGFYPDWAHTSYSLLRFLVYVLTFIFIFPYLPNSDSKVFQGVSVLVGVIFSLGSTSLISNMMAGLVITYMRPFLKGDHVKIGDVTGDVLEKTPFVTRIKTYKQEVVTIPNAQILSGNVTNYSTTAREDGGVIFSTTVTIGYDVEWRKVHSMMIQAALRSDLVLKTPAPYVIQTSLDDSYVSYQLCAYTLNPQKQSRVYSDLHQNIQDVFAENNVEIMSPAYRAERNGNKSTIPVVSEKPDAQNEQR